MASITGRTGSLSLLHFLLAVSLLPEGFSLELLPSSSEVLLTSNSNFTVVCSGWSQVRWRFPGVFQVGVAVEAEGSSSTLRLVNATWRNSGKYTCEEAESQQSREVDIFIPGQGPEQWFVPVGGGVVMRQVEVSTVPCVVSDPSLSVSLLLRPDRRPVTAATFEPGRGFTGRLEDASYLCVARQGDREAESQVYYVFSVIVPEELEVQLSVSSVVLRRGEELTVNCSVKHTEMIFFSWAFPRRQEVEPLTDFLSDEIRSFINISNTTTADTGVYVCEAQEAKQQRTVRKNITVTVLDRGYVYLWSGDLQVSAILFHSVELTVEIDAHPPPSISWTPPSHTVTTETTSISRTPPSHTVTTETASITQTPPNHTVTMETASITQNPPSHTVTTETASITQTPPSHTVTTETASISRTPPSHTVTMETASITQNPRSHAVTMETASITTTHLAGTRYVSTLRLEAVQINQTGNYTVTVSNEDDVSQLTFVLKVKAPPRITSLSEFGGQAVVCITEGAPPPSVTWYTCDSSHRCSNLTGGWKSQSEASEGGALQENITEGRGLTQVRSVLSLHSLMSLSAVRCEAKNSAGRRIRDLRILPNSRLSQVLVLAAILVLVIIAVIFLTILIILWRKKPQHAAWLVSADGCSFLKPSHLKHNLTWEVPREHVHLGEVLCSGTFGCVVMATVSGLVRSQSTTEAAVKMVKRGVGVRSLMAELKVLVFLGPHLNVVNLLGATTTGGPVYLITEFCCHGDLLSYLQRNKQTFIQNNTHTKSDGGYMDMSVEDGVEETSAAADLQVSSVLSDSPLLTLSDLLGFSFQVSQAMNFLSSRKCVHRDLAARNVQVCEGKLLKLGDLGLGRDMKKSADYVTRGNSFLPVKWMAPESIFENIYTVQSNVWSYGVLLWEIFSLGASPYSELSSPAELCSALKNGHRMNPPPSTPQNMCAVLRCCWDEDPLCRPTFSSLTVTVGNAVTDTYKKWYFQLNDDFLKDSPAALRFRASGATDTQISSAPQVNTHLLAEPQQTGSYIIPISDITMETSSTALDAVSPPLCDSPLDAAAQQEVTSQVRQEEEEEKEEEEESCL